MPRGSKRSTLRARVVGITSGLSLRQRFAILPVLGLVLIVCLTWSFRSEYATQTALLNRVAQQELVTYDRISDASVKLTAQHLAIYGLLQGTDKPLDEEALYDQGKVQLDRIVQAMRELEAAMPVLRVGDLDAKSRREALVVAMQQYRKAVVSALTMTTVRMARAGEQFRMANEQFARMNATFSSVLGIERATIRSEIAARVRRGDEVSRFISVAGMALAAVLLLLSYWLSRVLSKALERQIRALTALSDSAGTHVALTGANELARVGQAVKVFGHALRELTASRAELEQRVRERTRELEEANRRLEQLATHDVLTQLPNRALFDDRVGVALAAVRRDAGMLAIMCVDLDRFKAVNDSLGHAAGDELLVTVSRRIQGCLRGADTVARMGGDEFTVLLSSIGHEGDTIAAAHRIICVVGEPVQLGGHTATVGASIGISFFPRHGNDAKTLHAHADSALYAAKQAGRGVYRIFGSEIADAPVASAQREQGD